MPRINTFELQHRIDSICGLCSKIWTEHSSTEVKHCNREMDLIQEQANDLMMQEQQAYDNKHHCKLPPIPDFDEACLDYQKICHEEQLIKDKKDKYLDSLLTPYTPAEIDELLADRFDEELAQRQRVDTAMEYYDANNDECIHGNHMMSNCSDCDDKCEEEYLLSKAKESCEQDSQWLKNNPDTCPFSTKAQLVEWAMKCKGFTKSKANKLKKKQLYAIWYQS